MERISRERLYLSTLAPDAAELARSRGLGVELAEGDEPTAELDTQMGLRVIGMFKDLIRERGLTIVMTTHDPNMMELADHVYTLEDGTLLTMGQGKSYVCIMSPKTSQLSYE